MRLSSSLINTPNGLGEARQYNLESYTAYICASQTSDGKQCGLVQYRSYGEISTGCSPRAIIALLDEFADEIGLVSVDELDTRVREYIQTRIRANPLNPTPVASPSTLTPGSSQSTLTPGSSQSTLTPGSSQSTPTLGGTTAETPITPQRLGSLDPIFETSLGSDRDLSSAGDAKRGGGKLVSPGMGSEGFTPPGIMFTRGFDRPAWLELEKMTVYDNLTKIRVDGIPHGATSEPEKFIAFIRQCRKMRNPDPHVHVYNNESEGVLEVTCDAGRLVRPLLIAGRYAEFKAHRMAKQDAEYARWRAQPHVTRFKHDFAVQWNTIQEYTDLGFIEYVDASEERMLVVASNDADWLLQEAQGKVVTHREIHDTLGLSAMTAQAAYMECNPSPRNTYECQMKMHAAGMHLAEALHHRPTQHGLLNAQKGLVTTMGLTARGEEYDAMSVIANVGQMPYKHGGNEDAVGVRRGFLQLGGGTSTITKTHTVKQDRTGSNSTRAVDGKPDPRTCIGMKPCNYDKLQKNGLPLEHEFIETGDPIIGRTTGLRGISSNATSLDRGDRNESKPTRRDDSLLNRGDAGIVMAVRIDTQANGMNEIKSVSIQSIRIRNLGDKVSTCHGKKGVIGYIIEDADMPFDPRTGMMLDIILPPLSDCSRMTLGEKRESLHGKARAIDPDRVGPFATPFCDRTALNAVIADVLVAAGYSRTGKDPMRLGSTGELIESGVFVGPIRVRILKHQSIDKKRSRSTGPRNAITRQPNEGQSRDGGLRFGEMERSALNASGTGFLAQEKQVTMVYLFFHFSFISLAFLFHFSCIVCWVVVNFPLMSWFVGVVGYSRTQFCGFVVHSAGNQRL